MKPLKILLYADPYNERVGVSLTYHDYLSKFGDVILMSPVKDTDVYLKIGDVLVLPGGADVDPSRYGEVPRSVTGRANEWYEYLDKNFVPQWAKTNKPIIGICRGMQTMNVIFGGTLIQHVKGHIGPQDRTKDCHPIFTNIKGFRRHDVNSYHHQAIAKLAEDFEAVGWSTVLKGCQSLFWNEKDLLIRKEYIKTKKSVNGNDLITWDWSPGEYYAFPEVIQHRTKPYVGFQYHPEETDDELANMKIIEAILKTYPERTNEFKFFISSHEGTTKATA